MEKNNKNIDEIITNTLELLDNQKQIPTYIFNTNNYIKELLKENAESPLIRIEYAIERYNLLDNEKFIVKLINKDGSLLQYASDRLKSNENVVKIATNQNIFSFKYANAELKKSDNFKSLRMLYKEANYRVRAVNDGYDIIGFSSDYLKDNEGFMLKVIRKCGGPNFLAVQYASERIKADITK